MQLIQLPHKTGDYTCPVNGIEDQYEWKTGTRLPDDFLMPLSMLGFVYIQQKRAPTPRMVLWGAGTGRSQHEFLGEVMGYRWNCLENTAFSTAFRTAKASLDRGVPVIIGLLDMYHLSYYPMMYHRMHIPQHYVLLVGYDDEKEIAYVQDNGKPDVQPLPYADLRPAWNVNNPGQGKPNTLFILKFNDRIHGLREMLEIGLPKRARAMLNAPVSFAGVRGIQKLAGSFSRWVGELDPQAYEASLRFLVTFSCSVVPIVPQRMVPWKLDTPDPHQAMRDRFARLLQDYGELYGHPAWVRASEIFAQSGKAIGEITDTVAEHLIGERSDLRCVPELFQAVARYEKQGFELLLE